MYSKEGTGFSNLIERRRTNLQKDHKLALPDGEDVRGGNAQKGLDFEQSEPPSDAAPRTGEERRDVSVGHIQAL